MAGRYVVPNNKLIIVMVGLPARGKSYITKKLARYLNWLQLETKIFNAGERRRATGRDYVDDVSEEDTSLSTEKFTQHVSRVVDMV